MKDYVDVNESVILYYLIPVNPVYLPWIIFPWRLASLEMRELFYFPSLSVSHLPHYWCRGSTEHLFSLDPALQEEGFLIRLFLLSDSLGTLGMSEKVLQLGSSFPREKHRTETLPHPLTHTTSSQLALHYLEQVHPRDLWKKEWVSLQVPPRCFILEFNSSTLQFLGFFHSHCPDYPGLCSYRNKQLGSRCRHLQEQDFGHPRDPLLSPAKK